MEHMPFGAFNPRFYGVSVFLSGDDRRDAHERYGQARDPVEWAKNTDGSSANDVYTLSALDHELRHFHDFLLSPLGTISMGLRMQASINGFQAMKALQRCPGRFVPVPLSRWIEWDTAARQRWIDSTGSFFDIERMDDIVALPHAADVAHPPFQAGAHAVPDSLPHEQQLSAYALSAAQAYASMGMLRKRRVSQFDLEVSADDVFEGAAHLVQLQAVWTGQGEVPAHRFFDFVLTSSAKHLEPLQILWQVLQQSSHTIAIQRVTELVTWMLLGSWEQLTSSGHPASRYFRVLELAALSPDNDAFIGPMPTAHLFDLLDALTESQPWRDNLASASASADRRKGFYSSLAETLKGGYFDDLFAVCTAWHEDQFAVRQTFLKDPESLAHPLRYLSEKRFPLPFVETRLGWGLHERDDWLDSPSHRVIAVDAEGKRVLCYISNLESGQTSETLDNVVSARLLTHMADFLFADEPVLDLYEHWCRSQVEAVVGKALVSVY